MNTVVVCVITSNRRRAGVPGNVLLRRGEANLTRSSVVLVSQLITVDKADLGDKIGTLSQQRVREILDGIQLVLEPRDRNSWEWSPARVQLPWLASVYLHT